MISSPLKYSENFPVFSLFPTYFYIFLIESSYFFPQPPKPFIYATKTEEYTPLSYTSITEDYRS